MRLVEKIIRKVGRACNRWLVDRYLKRTGLTIEEIIKRSVPPPAPLVFPRGFAADKSCGNVTDRTPPGQWVGPCATGEGTKITFLSLDYRGFKTKRLLATVS